MDILYLLVPLSVLLVFALMVLFRWALGAGQFDDLDREGERILIDGALLYDALLDDMPRAYTPHDDTLHDDTRA
jgi:cbb3-type cytochrome oxidase maturation protein